MALGKGSDPREPRPRREDEEPPPVQPGGEPGPDDPSLPPIAPSYVPPVPGGERPPGPVDGTVEDDLPLPPPPPPPANTPLAIPGTFAQPGTAGAVPFRTPRFLQNRVIGPTTFGPGSTLFGGAGGFSGLGDEGGQANPGDDDLVRRIVAGLSRGRG